MKILIFALLCSTANATEFKFTYTLDRDQLQYKTDAKNWDEAFKRGAQFCFDFFVKKEKALSEEKGLDIIDTCANPR
jgi:hypothetical protein